MHHQHQHSDPKTEACIKECVSCAHTCSETLFHHCLEVGGKHADASHVRLMIDCVEICNLAANFMIRGSKLHRSTCEVCAEICSACAKSCESVGEMDACVDHCKRCAESCSAMAEM